LANDRCSADVKRLVLGGLIFAVALAASPAHAKELAALKVCGAAGCAVVTDQVLLRDAIGLAETQGEPASVATPPPAPFFRLEFIVKGDEGSTPSFLQHYVPAAGAVSWPVGEGLWNWVGAGERRPLYQQATAGVKPFAAPRFTGVTVDGKPATDPASYARLLRLTQVTDEYPEESDWVPVEFVSARPSPWSTHAPTIEYSPSADILWRGTERISVPDAIAGRLEARKSLRGASHSSSFPWLALLGGVGGASLLIPAALIVRRRRLA
jgi:hypothetical protein